MGLVLDAPLEIRQVFFLMDRALFWPGREARIPMAVLAGEAGLLVGYGGCGRPGPGLGCAESLSGVP